MATNPAGKPDNLLGTISEGAAEDERTVNITRLNSSSGWPLERARVSFKREPQNSRLDVHMIEKLSFKLNRV